MKITVDLYIRKLDRIKARMRSIFMCRDATRGRGRQRYDAISSIRENGGKIQQDKQHCNEVYKTGDTE